MSAAALSTGPPGGRTGGGLAGLRQAWLSIDRNPAVIDFVSTPLGIVAINLAFVAGLAATWQFTAAAIALVSVTLAGCAVIPARRLAILTSASLLFFVLRPFRTQEFAETTAVLVGRSMPGLHPLVFQVPLALLFVVLVFLWLRIQRGQPSSLVGRRPLLVHLWAFFGLVGAGVLIEPGGWLHASFWIFMAIWASSFWMLAYMMADLKAKDPTPDAFRAGFMRPVWGGSATPIGKGHSYLAKFEARDEQALAQTRLKALKLIVWAALLHGVHIVLAKTIHDYLAIPTLHDAVMADIAGEPFGRLLNWTGLIATYFIDLVIIAYWGHVLVAIVRMIGYAIPRNTVNPLASRSLAEFWNRYFFYYKELLVDFFFYPVFLRWFKKSPRLRIAFATFCAAGFGNFLYHAMSEIHLFAFLDPWSALSYFPTFAFYTLVLATGLIVSQIRGHRPKPEDGFLRYEVTPRLTVMLFFCLLKIFDDIFGYGSLADRLAFFFRLFGVAP